MIAQAFRQAVVLLLFALCPAAISGAVQLTWKKPAQLGEGEVALATVRTWGDAVLWVDARSQAKFERAHIPGAVLLNEDDWVRLVGPFLDAWEPEKKIVVYCDGGSCDASHEVARRIRSELGLESAVWVLQGGWDAWRLGK